MTRARVLLPLALLLAAGACSADPVLLRYTPEDGLAVPYDVELSGSMGMGGGGQSMNQDFKLVGSFDETVTAIRSTKVTLRRKFDKLTAIVDGQREDAPDEVINQVTTYTLNELGAVESSEATGGGGGGGPDPMNMVMGALVRVPFAEQAVEVGDSWDSSDGYEVIEGIKIKAETTLVGLYESDGMQVALTQTTFTGSGTLAMPGISGAAAPPPLKVEVEGAVLQSTRVDDGCMLGLRVQLDATAELSMPGAGSFTINMKDIKGEVRVGK